MSKRKQKQKQRRAEKRAERTGSTSTLSALTPAQDLLARISLERRIRHEQSQERFKDEQERLWLAEERRRARQPKVKTKR